MHRASTHGDTITARALDDTAAARAIDAPVARKWIALALPPSTTTPTMTNSATGAPGHVPPWKANVMSATEKHNTAHCMDATGKARNHDMTMGSERSECPRPYAPWT